MQLRVDRSRCIGGGLCVLTAPAVFDQSPDGLVTLRDKAASPADGIGVGDEELERVQQAEEICPGQAIRLSKR